MTKFALLGIVLFIGVSAFAQTQTEKEIKYLLAHKWKLTHIEQDGKKKVVPAEFSESFLDIKADGTILEIDPDKQNKGKWSYDHKTKTLTVITEIDPWIFEVKVNETELVMKMTEEGMTKTAYLKRVN